MCILGGFKDPMRRKYMVYALFFLLISLLVPRNVLAFEHVYQRKTEAIYATVRHDLEVFEDIGGDVQTYIPEFKGIKVWKEETYWYRIEYKEKGETRTGWITRYDFYGDCLIYDGREKQTLADGEYQMTISKDSSDMAPPLFSQDLSMDGVFHCTFHFIGDRYFTIMNTETGEYLQPDPMFSSNPTGFWGPKESAGAFRVTRDDRYLRLQDKTSRRFLCRNSDGLICFNQSDKACWRLLRYNKAIDDKSVRVFAQFDADWADYYYGDGENEDPGSNVFTTSACGVFSTMNAIYAVTGMYANPYDLAEYAVEENYRVMDNGTDSGFFKAAAEKFGDKYGFSYNGSSGDIEYLKKKVSSDNVVAITHVPGHYVAIASYNKKKDKFLLLDPYHLDKRSTNAYGDWISITDLEDGNLMGYEFFFYKAERPKK